MKLLPLSSSSSLAPPQLQKRQLHSERERAETVSPAAISIISLERKRGTDTTTTATPSLLLVQQPTKTPQLKQEPKWREQEQDANGERKEHPFFVFSSFLFYLPFGIVAVVVLSQDTPRRKCYYRHSYKKEGPVIYCNKAIMCTTSSHGDELPEGISTR